MPVDTHIRSTLQKIFVSVFLTVLFGLQLRAMVLPLEMWPFTSATMFAYYVEPGAALYRFRFLWIHDGRETVIDAAEDLGLAERELRRLFFSQYYGSTDPNFAQGHFPADTPEAFRRRLDTFCRRAVAVTQRRGRDIDGMKIELLAAGSAGDGGIDTTVVTTYHCQ